MAATSSTRTGHFTIDHTVRAVLPSPRTLAAFSASGPVNTTITTLIMDVTIISSVSPIRSGMVFHIGRRSRAPYTTFDARMKAPTYPDADHRAPAIPAAASVPPAPPLDRTCVIAVRNTSRTDPGASFCTLSKTVSTVEAPMSPSTDMASSSVGNTARKP